MKKRNILLILLVLMTRSALAQYQQTSIPAKSPKSMLICELSPKESIWMSKAAFGSVRNKPFDQLRSFDIPNPPVGGPIGPIYYLAQSAKLDELIAPNYKHKFGENHPESTFITKFTISDQYRLVDYMLNHCNIEGGLDLEQIHASIDLFERLKGKTISTYSMPSNMERILRQYHDTATAAEALAHR